VEGQSRAALKAHFVASKKAEEADIEANGYFNDPTWRELLWAKTIGNNCRYTRVRIGMVTFGYYWFLVPLLSIRRRFSGKRSGRTGDDRAEVGDYSVLSSQS
jgi:hypothetical protein